MSELSNKLRDLREAKHLTQEELAKTAEIKYDTYRKYEMGQTTPRMEHLSKLAKVHGLSIEELIGVGGSVTVKYAPEDIANLRSALRADLPPKEKAERIDEALEPLLNTRDKAFTIPDALEKDHDPLNPNSLTQYLLRAGRIDIKKISFDAAEDHLILSALSEKYNLLVSAGQNYNASGITMYDINTLTIDDVRDMIAAGDDTHDNQIRVTQAGEVYLSQDIVGADSIGNLRFRFETFDAGNGYVGPGAAANDEYISRIYRNLIGNWKDGKWGTYVDVLDY